MLQVKDIPEDVHRELKARAALEGMTLTEYAREQLTRAARRPSRRQLVDDLRTLEPLPALESSADALAAVRAEHEAA